MITHTTTESTSSLCSLVSLLLSCQNKVSQFQCCLGCRRRPLLSTYTLGFAFWFVQARYRRVLSFAVETDEFAWAVFGRCYQVTACISLQVGLRNEIRGLCKGDDRWIVRSAVAATLFGLTLLSFGLVGVYSSVGFSIYFQANVITGCRQQQFATSTVELNYFAAAMVIIWCRFDSWMILLASIAH